LNKKTIPKYYIFLSLLVLILFSSILVLYPQKENINSPLDRIILGIFFISCCMVGISFSIFPGWYKKYLNKKTKIDTQKSKNQVYILRKGHHPYCDHFKNHTINIHKKTYCAGCLGLSIGAVTAIIMTIGYMFIYNIQQQSYVIFGIGASIIIISFIASLLNETKPVLRVIINTLFIIGFFPSLEVYLNIHKILIFQLSALFFVSFLSKQEYRYHIINIEKYVRVVVNPVNHIDSTIF